MIYFALKHVLSPYLPDKIYKSLVNPFNCFILCLQIEN